MKVLLVTLCSLEDNASVTLSNIGLIKGFQELGYEVSVIAPTKNTSTNNYDNTMKLPSGIKIHYIQSNTKYERIITNNNSKVKKMIISLLRSIYHKISIYDNTIDLVKNFKLPEKTDFFYDLVVSTSDPKTSHLYVGKLIRNGLKYSTWIQHWGDPLSIDISNSSIYPKWILKIIEKKIISIADKIIYVSPFTADAQKFLFPELSSRMLFAPLPYEEAVQYQITRHESLVFGYFGSYNSKIRNIQPLFNSFIENTEYKLVVAGNGDVNVPKIKNISIMERVSRNKIKELESESDILICICNKSGTQIPGKLYYYAATNRPILVILDGEYSTKIRIFLEGFNRYICCENSVESINQAIKNWSSSSIKSNPVVEFSAANVAAMLR